MATKDVPLNGAVLTWAREESGFSRGHVAESIGVDVDVVATWETGDSRPTTGQFTKLVRLLKRPSAVFFLPKPPVRAALPTSFRMASGLSSHDLTDGEVRQVRWARRLQELVSWALSDGGAESVELNRYTPADPPSTAAEDFRFSLGVLPAEQLGWSNPSEAFRSWRSVLEEAGVVVLQLSLGRTSVRGFSAWDDFAPLVAVNSAYHPTARIYTLFHEVGHLLTRTDAACLSFVLPSDPEEGVERWCERFSADLLMPEEAFREVAERVGIYEGSSSPDVERARRIASRFKVSTRAVSLRLQELGLAPPGFYGAVESHLAKFDWNEGGGGGGQPAPEKRLGQLGARVPAVLLDAQAKGRLNRADLADHLQLTTGQVEELRSLVRLGG